MTTVTLYNSLDCALASIQLKDEDATGEAIANAACELVQQTGVLHEGDTIRIEVA